jgi:hypothetical protein
MSVMFNNKPSALRKPTISSLEHILCCVSNPCSRFRDPPFNFSAPNRYVQPKPQSIRSTRSSNNPTNHSPPPKMVCTTRPKIQPPPLQSFTHPYFNVIVQHQQLTNSLPITTLVADTHCTVSLNTTPTPSGTANENAIHRLCSVVFLSYILNSYSYYLLT